MGFGVRDLEIDDLPARLPFAAHENGIGLILRDQGRLVGFELIDRPPGIDWIDPTVFAGSEVTLGSTSAPVREMRSGSPSLSK